MKEEIIIDCVNVKDCERRFGKNNFCRYFKRNCADNNYNCIWKKCLRLEQENRELKAYKDVNEDFKKAWDELNEKYKQLRSALEEIKRITEEDRNCMNSELACCQLCDKLDLIKDKINEVLQ